MTIRRFVCAAMLLFCTTAKGQIRAMPEAVRTCIISVTEPDWIGTVSAIPQEVLREMDDIYNADQEKMADPGGQFRATDVGSRDIPRCRLIWCARWRGMYLVHFEIGGQAHLRRLSAVTYSEVDLSAKRVWLAASISFAGFDDFKAFLLGKAVTD